MDLSKFKFNKKILSVHLFKLLRVETHVYVKVGATCVFGSAQNVTFWKKLRFGPRLKTH